MIYRKVPETPVPMMLVILCSEDWLLLTAESRALTPKFSSTESKNTMVEWPSEKKNPTLSGRCPSLMSLRVVLSIAEMWSASNAWRIPRVRATNPRPKPKTYCLLSLRWPTAATPAANRSHPSTQSPTTLPTMRPKRTHSFLVRALRMRLNRDASGALSRADVSDMAILSFPGSDLVAQA